MRVDQRALYIAARELAKVGAKNRLPALGHVLLRAEAGVLRLVATDLVQTLRCELPADGEIHALLPAKILANIIKPSTREAGDVLIEPVGNDVRLQVGDVKTKLAGLPPDNFPSHPEREWSLLGIWPATPLHDSLRFVLPAASTDSSRPHLGVVCLDRDHAVATDGHRLHLAPLPALLGQRLLVPAPAAATLLRLLHTAEQVIAARANDRLRVGVCGWQLETKVVDAEFPPFHHVIPDRSNITTHLRVESKAINTALAQLGRLSPRRETRLRVNGVVTLGLVDDDLGQAEVVVPTITNNHEGNDLVVAFDRRYLADAIATAEVVELGFNAPLNPLRVDLDRGKVAVVMPVRV